MRAARKYLLFWTPQQLCSLDLEHARKPIDHVNACSVDASFKSADVGAVQIGPCRQLLLRQASKIPHSSKIQRKDVADLHDPQGMLLSSILPRSIHYNRNQWGPP